MVILNERIGEKMKSLFDQTQVSGMKLKNRCIRSATMDVTADKEGHVTDKLLELYEKLAKEGVGTIITGGAFVTDVEQHFPGQLGIYNDSFIDEYKKLTDICHQYDARIILQLVSLGFQPFSDGSKVMWVPSVKEEMNNKIAVTEMTYEDILFVQKAFAEAAFRAKMAKFDGIQIHAAHDSLLSRFLTPYYNRRIDNYGGSIENRARIIIETYEAIRSRVGLEYPILVKINSEDFLDQGMTFAECQYVCKKLSELGINVIEISGGGASSRSNEGPIRVIKPDQESYFKIQAAEIAKTVKQPIILVGGNRDYHSLTQIINQTSIEYIAFSRPLLCESNLIHRWQKGDLQRAKCISCNQCFSPDEISCFFNRNKS
jgi:2,4-dienoyl-CoA reductase-like NADH-dependent reductase (Old Yellow Enzyme family)